MLCPDYLKIDECGFSLTGGLRHVPGHYYSITKLEENEYGILDDMQDTVPTSTTFIQCLKSKGVKGLNGMHWLIYVQHENEVANTCCEQPSTVENTSSESNIVGCNDEFQEPCVKNVKLLVLGSAITFEIKRT